MKEEGEVCQALGTQNLLLEGGLHVVNKFSRTYKKKQAGFLLVTVSDWVIKKSLSLAF